MAKDRPEQEESPEQRKGTDEPWKRPGQSSQNPSDPPPPKRTPEENDNKTK